jgi:hypothetical protein
LRRDFEREHELPVLPPHHNARPISDLQGMHGAKKVGVAFNVRRSKLLKNVAGLDASALGRTVWTGTQDADARRLERLRWYRARASASKLDPH